ncbi:tetratricopeptide repeat protein [Microscilla marina]|uniref:Tetratricopeptide repeat domain protein n=1 Tax=Microscilla marina ATCC 23134 TaxID=313606 RepID=A1ZLM9_MICM2|nr:tetratricopeptide repeat protein [Microscilla marina]EAY28783.1 tetratricopeptide repeat domain protein [Microscilla marina ATCC 23134]
MSDFDQILQNYVRQILKIQQERAEAPLQTEELKRIAENLGLSENDWQHIQSTFDASLARGKSFVQYKSWDNAIKELQLAVKINPAHADALYHLAVAYWQRNRKKGKKTDMKQAEAYARRCVQADYAHDAALRLISRLEKQKTPKTSKQSILLVALVLLTTLGVSGYIIWDMSRDKMPINKLPVHATPPPPKPKNTEPVIVKKTDNRNVIDLPVVLHNGNDNATGLALDLESSLYRRGDYEMLYQLRGSIQSKVFEVSQLTLRLKLVDRNGEVKFEKDFEVLNADKDVPIRPNDYIPFAKIFRQQTFPPHFKDALLSVVKISKTSPEGKYEPAKLVPLQWEQSPPVGINIEVRQREETMIPNSDKFSHDFILEVKNTGTLTIKSLKVDVRWFNDKDKLAHNEEMTLVAPGNAMLKPQQTRLKKGEFMVGLKKANYKDFDLIILEIK